MLWAASLSPAPATPIDLALNSASWFFRPSLMLPCMSAKKGSWKNASLLDNSSCFSCILMFSTFPSTDIHSVWLAKLAF